MRLRLLTFNIAHGRGLSLYQGLVPRARLQRTLAAIGALIERSQADLVALQEVDADSHWNGHLDLLAEIAAQAPHLHRAHGLHNRREGRYRLNYGNALLSRLPLEQVRTHAFGAARVGEKGFLHAELRLPDGRLLPLINLHLHYRSRRLRLAQLAQLLLQLEKMLAAVDGERLPPVICGDFNTSDRSDADALRVLHQWLDHRLEYAVQPRSVRTFPTHFPTRALDFVLLPKAWEVTGARALRSRLSDHLPVLVEFVIPRRAARLPDQPA